MFPVTIQIYIRNFLNTGPKLVTQLLKASVFFIHFKAGQTISFTHTHDLVRGQGTGTHSAFMTAAVNLCFKTNARFASDIKRADSLRTIDLVTRHTHQINRILGHIKVQFTNGLSGINVEENATFTAHLTDGIDILDNTDFIVDSHDGNQNSVITHGRFQCIQIQKTIGQNVHVGHIKAFRFQMTHAVQNGLVFGLHRDEVLAAVFIKVSNTFERQVVRLGSPGCPNNFARIGVDHLSDLRTGFFDSLAGFQSVRMRIAGRIAETLVEPGNHLFYNTGINRSRGTVVQVNRFSQFELLNESTPIYI